MSDAPRDEVYHFVGTQGALRLFGLVASRYTLHRYDMEDLVQDMALRCLEQAHRYRGGNVEAWARVVATRVALNTCRQPNHTKPHYSFEEQWSCSPSAPSAPSASALPASAYDMPDSQAEAKDLARVLWDTATEKERMVIRHLLQNTQSVGSCARKVGMNPHTMQGIRRRLRLRAKSLTCPMEG